MLDKILMTIKKTEYITVEISEDRGYEMPEGLSDTFEFIEDIKSDFQEQIQDVDLAEARTDYKLETFTIKER